jgi:hypothetical protein
MPVLPLTEEKYCMAKKRLLASAALAAGLLGGGAAGFVLGVPGVSGAQTTTVPDQPGTSVPNDGQTNPGRPPHDPANCPNMGGGGGGTPGQAPSGSSANTGFHRGPARV